MALKWSTKDFITRAITVHGPDRYDYGQVDYQGSQIKVTIICNVCGNIFEQTPSHHINRKQGCMTCGARQRGEKKRNSVEKFIQKAEDKHGAGRYDYSQVVYTTNRSKVTIGCCECGEWFDQTPAGHADLGHGCPSCGTKQGAETRRCSNAEFIRKAEEKHGVGRYDYTRVDYRGAMKKVTIICRECGNTFEQRPSEHTNQGSGCPDCGQRRTTAARRGTAEEFIRRAQAKYGLERYDYSAVKYIDSHTRVSITCNLCGQAFGQSPTNHIDQGTGCPFCRQSRGEAALVALLKREGLTYTRQKRYPKELGRLSYDFHLQLGDDELLIEFDGEQHFWPNERFGGDAAFRAGQERDLRKTLYAIEKGIPLLRLHFSVLDPDQLATYLNRAIDSDSKLMVSDSYWYRNHLESVLASCPDVPILYLGGTAIHPSWAPEAVELFRTEWPEFDLSRSLDDMNQPELWRLAQLTGNVEYCSARSSAQWLREVLNGLPPRFESAVRAAAGDLAAYLFRAL